MSCTDLQTKQKLSYLSAGNMAYINGLYEDYLHDPSLVDNTWREIFDALPPSNDSTPDISQRDIEAYFVNKASSASAAHAQPAPNAKQADVTNLINAYRQYGHIIAKLDPLDRANRSSLPVLELAYHHLNEADLNTPFYAERPFSIQPIPLSEIYRAIRETYCGSIGIEYMHVSDTKETSWFQEKLEPVRGKASFSDQKKMEILQELIAADGLERYLGTRYVGQKRFSLEGGDALVPLLKELIRSSSPKGVKEIVIGMAHRGRLNVLINVLGKSPDVLFQEFEGKIESPLTGDVKYHLGFSADLRTEDNGAVHVALAFNPSHLEIIAPVVEGSTRSRLRRHSDLKVKNAVLPVLIHGDAAFAGQGVVMETFNLSQARGYSTGGTVHIIINNQIGFTTSNPMDARSSLHCTDVAKMVQAPILHVNGDDPEAVVFATQIAFEYRMKFKRDIVIDLMCYRRNGHNEADEPSVTQPLMYKAIKSHRPLRELYAEQLIEAGITSQNDVDALNEAYRDKLDKGESVVEIVHEHYAGKVVSDWTPYFRTKWNTPADTSVSMDTLQDLSEKLLRLPEGFKLHPVVKRLMDERKKMSSGEIPMNWGYAETMAYATLSHEGYGIRLSGQDSGRGTFAHRHAVLHDADTAQEYVPLQTVGSNPMKTFVVIDSLLSEEAVLAFEYGYAASEPSTLVLWEAQFGDFANGAQVVVDQFISSGEQKWGRLCGLVMLLPHGYEGQGPEHSSARLERYMQLCAQQNMQVCVPTTPAQIFHLLRRQMIRPYRKPLIIMTPKSLMRHKLAVSELADLTDGSFHPVIPEIDDMDAAKITRIVLCSGKVYYDLLIKRREEKLMNVAIIRIEQLYPFPREMLKKLIAKYPNAARVIWCQEEPQNQGVWFTSQHHIRSSMREEQELFYAGRPFAAAPAVGSFKLHLQQQEALVQEALSG